MAAAEGAAAPARQVSTVGAHGASPESLALEVVVDHSGRDGGDRQSSPSLSVRATMQSILLPGSQLTPNEGPGFSAISGGKACWLSPSLTVSMLWLHGL